MPYLRFKGFDEEMLREHLSDLVAEFARVAGVPREIVKIELLNITRITETPPSVEIFMFPRSQEMHDAIASALHGLLEHAGCGDAHLFFVLLSPALYYKQGRALKNISWLPESHPPEPC
jgi:hypothetical protein